MPSPAQTGAPQSWLLVRVGSRLCALPLGSVVETMRMLPIEPLARTSAFILGMCILRDTPLPVVDVGLLFGERSSGRRLISVRIGGRLAALAVDEVLGLRQLQGEALPPLLRSVGGDVVSAIATLDAELLLLLDTARIVTDAVTESDALEDAL